MKKLIIILSIALFSCETPSQRIDEFNQLEPPVILMAKSSKPYITVIDSNNKIITFSDTFVLAHTISESYDVGDTIIHKVLK